MDHTGNTTPTRKKVIPYVRFETLKHVKNLTLLGGTRSPQIYSFFLLSVKQQTMIK